jgi:hypothetical protein
MLVQIVWSLERIAQPLREHVCIADPPQPGLHDREFVAPKARDNIGFAYEAL